MLFSNKILLLNPLWKAQWIQKGTERFEVIVNENGYPAEWDLSDPLLYRQISLFHSPITNIKLKKDLSLYEIYLLIRSDKFRLQTDKLRSIKDKKENSLYKRNNFHYATFSGKFKTRNDQNILAHSELIAIDLDHLGEDLYLVKQKINLLPETVMSFISPNGDGLKVIFRIDPSKYTQERYYKLISKFLQSYCHLEEQHLDSSCKNVSRACFLPSDPDAFINPKLLTNEYKFRNTLFQN